MSHREWQSLVGDILDAIGRIQEYTAGMVYGSMSISRTTGAR